MTPEQRGKIAEQIRNEGRVKFCGCGNPEGTDPECERCRFITEVAILAKQRDALLDVCRNFVACDTQWAAALQYTLLERLLEELKDITTTDPDDGVKRCSQCDGLLDEEGDGTRCHLCCEYVSPEDQRRNDAAEA